MTAARKLMIAASAIALGALLAPIAFTALSARGIHGYFEDGRCACGYDKYVRIEGDDYFGYAPGHGYPPHLVFKLRPDKGEYEMLALGDRSDGKYLSFGPAEGSVVGRLRLQDGALWEQWAGKTNWTRHARV